MSANLDTAGLAAVNAFLRQYAEDQDARNPRSLRDYQQLFPGHEAEVARKWSELHHPADEDRSPSDDPSLRYRIRHELGRGGQGVVYLARDERLRRDVAIKMLHRALDPDGIQLARFRREAEATSRLNHPGICAVHDAGELEGSPFLALEYVPGESLARKIARSRERGASCVQLHSAASQGPGSAAAEPRVVRATPADDLGATLQLMQLVADAVHAAHESGVIHRDLKPSNIMIRESGRPAILDFGLARVAQTELPSLTQSGDVLGSPSYMAPEQIQTDLGRCDRRTDVYALGVSLYECLTLRLPFEAPTREGLYRKILSSDATHVRAVNPAIPRDLQLVVETAMEKDPDRRYQTAHDLAEDLQSVRRGEPIRARPPGPWQRLRRFGRRHPVLSTSSVAAAAILTLGLIGSLTHAARLRDTLRRARAINIAVTSADLQDRDGRLALLLAREAVRADATPRTVSQLQAALASMTERVRLEGHVDYVGHVRFSPDGSRILTASGDGTARLFDRTGAVLAVMQAADGESGPGRVRDALFSPDGTRILTAYQGGSAALWTSDGTRVCLLPHRRAVFSVDFSPTDDRLLSASVDGTLKIWNGRGELLTTLRAPRALYDGEFSADGRWVVGACADGTALLWRPEGPGEERVVLGGPDGHSRTVLAAHFSPTGDRILTMSSGGSFMDPGDFSVRLWDLTGRHLATLDHEDEVFSAVFDPSGDRVLTASRDHTVVLWNLDADGQLIGARTLLRHPVQFHSAVFSPSGQRILVTGTGGFAGVLGLDGQLLNTLAGHSGLVLSGGFSPDGSLICTASMDRTARLWSLSAEGWTQQREPLGCVAVSIGGHIATVVPEGIELRDQEGAALAIMTEAGPGARLSNITFSPDGELLMATTFEGRILVWDGDGKVVFDRPGPHETSAASWCALDPDGRHLAVGRQRRAYLLDMETDAVVVLEGHERYVRSVEFSSSGDRLVTASWDGNAILWTRDGTILDRLPHPSRRVNRACFSPQGTHVLTGCDDHCAYLWDLDEPGEGRSPAVVLRGHEGSVTHVAFSPRGELIATASEDGTARLWSMQGETLQTLRAHESPVLRVAFDPLRPQLWTTSLGSLRCWPVTHEELLLQADRRLSPFQYSAAEQERYAEFLQW